MDFSVLLNDLRDVAEKCKGQTSEPQVSTHAYVDTFTKILKKAQKVTEEYDDQITVLWVALNQLASIYKDLSAGSARDQLCKFIFGMCAKTVLNIQWSQLEEDSKVKTNFSTTVEEVHKILSQQGFHKFQLILDLMESHWTHPVLSKIMSGEEEDTDDCLEYIQKEDPDILKLRIEIMMKENCEEFALNLCTWSLKHPQLINDLKIKEHQIFMLYKQQEYGKMQEVCETVVCHDGIRVMSHLAKTPANQELCIRLAQVFLIQDWMRPERTCCTQELLKLWIHHQYLADKDEERFLDSIWTVAKVCRDTEQIRVLIDGVRKECGDMFVQLYFELYKYAINIDKGNMERVEVQQDKDEYTKRRLAMSKTCVKMALILKEYDFRMSRICGLTAFSLDPTTENLNLVNKLYWTIKNVSAASENSKINIATLYEIERLLGQMRPEVLSADYSWKQLIPLCKKYKIDFENGKYSIPGKKESKESTQSSNMDTATNHPDVETDQKITKNIDTGQKNARKQKLYETPNDIQKTHLAKLLKEKKLTNEEIEKVLAKEFPRNVSKAFDNAPSLDVKELDKTISDLKKSIDLETQYRQFLNPLKHSRKASDDSSKGLGGVTTQHMSRQEQYLHQQNTAGRNRNSGTQRQHSAPGGSQSQGQILHRQLSMGSPQPPYAHSHHHGQHPGSNFAKFGGSPPPAHSISPRLSSPTGFQSSVSPPGYRSHSTGPNILKNSRNQDSFSQKSTSQSRSDIITKLCNKIQGETSQTKSETKSQFNILRPPGNSKQECAKIAQQIAEMHEKQRAEREERERHERMVAARIQGFKAALNSRNIPSRSQISDLLSLTFQGNKTDNLKNALPNSPDVDMSMGKNYLKKKSEPATVSSVKGKSPQSAQRPNTSMNSPNSVARQTPSKQMQKNPCNTAEIKSGKQSDNDSVLVPGEQAWDASRGMMKQKFYYKSPAPKGAVTKSSPDGQSLSMKPVYSMIVPKDLINPSRKEELMKTVTTLMKQFPKGGPQQQQQIQQPPQQQQSQQQSQFQNQQQQLHQQQQQQLPQQQNSHPLQTEISSLSSVGVQNHGLAVQSQQAGINQQMQYSSQYQNLATSSIQNSIAAFNSQSQLQPGISTVSQPLVQNTPDDGMLNLNTLANASISVLGQSANNPQIINTMQLAPPQALQQNQIFTTTIVEPQTLFSPIQQVQSALPGQETILATPLYTMPSQVIPDPVLTQQLTGTQLNDASMQLIGGHNQSVAIGNSPQLVNVVNQQPAFQVTNVGQVVGATQPIPGISTLISPCSYQQSPVTPNPATSAVSLPISNVGMSQQVSMGMSEPVANTSSPVTQKPFINAPELSPALVQQILTSLKKVKQTNQTQSEGIQNEESQSHAPIETKTTLNETVKDNLREMLASQQVTAEKQSVNEAKQKIQELRKQFGQTMAPTFKSGDNTSATVNRNIPTVVNKGDRCARKSSYLERLMSDDQDSSKEPANIPNFLTSPATSKNSPNVNTAPCYQPVIPELPDLGAKEFQIDSFLALDNESSLINTKPPKQSAASVSRETSKSDRGSASQVSLKGSDNTGGNMLKSPARAESRSTEHSVIPPQQHDKRPDHPANQSTYYNANRLGKQRESKEVKNERESKPHALQEGNRQTHLQTGEKILCAKCDNYFPTEQHLLEHRQNSKCESKWHCTFCKMNFNSSDILRTHEKHYCLKAPSSMVNCFNCGAYFQTHEQVKSHLNLKTCTPKTLSDGKKTAEEIICGICARKFETMFEIKEHVKIGCVGKSSNFSTGSQLQVGDYSQFFKCAGCNFMNENGNIVSNHVEQCKEKNTTAILAKAFQCNMCKEMFSNHGDIRRHASKQCPNLKIASTQKQVQDNYERLKGANSNKMKAKKPEKSVKDAGKNDVKIDSSKTTKTVKRNKKQVIKQEPVDSDVNEVSTTTKITVDTTTKATVDAPSKTTADDKVSNEKSSDKVTEIIAESDKNASVKQEARDSQNSEKVIEFPDEETAQLQKLKRISLENQFLAEFNAIEKKRKELKRKKQEDREIHKAVLDKSEQILRDSEMLNEQPNKLDREIGKEPIIIEKSPKVETTFEIEKRKHIDSILGNTSLQQIMKNDLEKQRKAELMKEIKSKIKTETEQISESCESESGVKEDPDSFHSKNRDFGDSESPSSTAVSDKVQSIITEPCKHVVRNGVTLRDKMNSRNKLVKKETGGIRYWNSRKQRSPQDIRKMRGLRAKRLIKRQKFFIENFEMEPLRRANLKKDQEKNRSSNDLKSQTEELSEVQLDDEKSIIGSFINLRIRKTKACLSQEDKNLFRVICYFCGFQKPKNKDICDHYIYYHNLGFRTIGLYHFCNYCKNKLLKTRTKEMKDHVYQEHREPIFQRVAIGKYNGKVKTSFKEIGVRIKPSVRTSNATKHIRAVELREKCAERLRMIAKARENVVIEYSEDETIDQSTSNSSTDNESREARIANVNAKITLLAGEQNKNEDTRYGTRLRDGKRIAPRLERKMVKDGQLKDRGKKQLRSSETEDSVDVQILTRSRSSSTSSRSSLIVSAKKRKSAIAFSSRSGSHARQRRLSSGDKLILTRSGRAVKRPEIESDKVTESSGLESGENSEFEESHIRRRKSTRVRRLSERGKMYQDKKSETDESSTEETKVRVTRQSSKTNTTVNESDSKGSETDESSADETRPRITRRQSLKTSQVENEVKSSKGSETEESSTEEVNSRVTRRQSLKNSQVENKRRGSESVDSDHVIKRVRNDRSPGGILKNENVNVKKRKAHQKREKVNDNIERITRQNSKNVEESDSETESNYSDIERKVQLRNIENEEMVEDGSAESDSDSTSVENKKLKRKYRLRKRSSLSQYKESESSDSESGKSVRTRSKHCTVDNDADLELAEEIDDMIDEDKVGDKSEGENIGLSDGSESETGDIFEDSSGKTKDTKPKVVLIGPEDDDDLNVDYGINSNSGPVNNETFDTSTNSEASVTKIPDEVNTNESKEIGRNINVSAASVLLNPDEEFSDLMTLPVESAESQNESEKECDVPVSIMDEEEFKFLKYGSVPSESVTKHANKLSSSFKAAEKVAFDTEFLKYTNTEKESESDTDRDSSDEIKDGIQNKNDDNDSVVRSVLEDNVILPLLEDVPVLPPRDVTTNRYVLEDSSVLENSSDDSTVIYIDFEEKRKAKLNKEDKNKKSLKNEPRLKSARVVIEDISVVKKALEEEAERKLKEACEKSVCRVNIARLAKEQIAQYTAWTAVRRKENKSETDFKDDSAMIIIDNSDEGGIDSKKIFELNQVKVNDSSSKEIATSNEKSQDILGQPELKEKEVKEKPDKNKVTEQQNETEQPNETLIKDVLLDESVIDGLLSGEAFVIDGITSSGIVDTHSEGIETLQIVLENNCAITDNIIAVDINCEPSKGRSNSVGESSKIVIIEAGQGGQDNKPRVGDTGVEEEEVWVENAETYAETLVKPDTNAVNLSMIEETPPYDNTSNKIVAELSENQSNKNIESASALVRNDMNLILRDVAIVLYDLKDRVTDNVNKRDTVSNETVLKEIVLEEETVNTESVEAEASVGSVEANQIDDKGNGSVIDVGKDTELTLSKAQSDEKMTHEEDLDKAWLNQDKVVIHDTGETAESIMDEIETSKVNDDTNLAEEICHDGQTISHSIDADHIVNNGIETDSEADKKMIPNALGQENTEEITSVSDSKESSTPCELELKEMSPSASGFQVEPDQYTSVEPKICDLSSISTSNPSEPVETSIDEDLKSDRYYETTPKNIPDAQLYGLEDNLSCPANLDTDIETIKVSLDKSKMVEVNSDEILNTNHDQHATDVTIDAENQNVGILEIIDNKCAEVDDAKYDPEVDERTSVVNNIDTTFPKDESSKEVDAGEEIEVKDESGENQTVCDNQNMSVLNYKDGTSDNLEELPSTSIGGNLTIAKKDVEVEEKSDESIEEFHYSDFAKEIPETISDRVNTDREVQDTEEMEFERNSNDDAKENETAIGNVTAVNAEMEIESKSTYIGDSAVSSFDKDHSIHTSNESAHVFVCESNIENQDIIENKNQLLNTYDTYVGVVQTKEMVATNEVHVDKVQSKEIEENDTKSEEKMNECVAVEELEWTELSNDSSEYDKNIKIHSSNVTEVKVTETCENFETVLEDTVTESNKNLEAGFGEIAEETVTETNKNLETGIAEITEETETNKNLETGVAEITEVTETNKNLETGVAEITEVTETSKNLETGIAEVTESNKNLETGIAEIAEVTETNQNLETGIGEIAEVTETNKNLETGIGEIAEVTETNQNLVTGIGEITEVTETNKNLETGIGEIVEVTETNKILETGIGEVAEVTETNKILETGIGEVAEVTETNKNLETGIAEITEVTETKKNLETGIGGIAEQIVTEINKNLETCFGEIAEDSITETNGNENLKIDLAQVDEITAFEAVENLETASSEISGTNENLKTEFDGIAEVTVMETSENLETVLDKIQDVKGPETSEFFETDSDKTPEVSGFETSENLEADLAENPEDLLKESEFILTETNENLETNSTVIPDISVRKTNESLESDFDGIAEVSLNQANKNENLKTDEATVNEVTALYTCEDLEADTAIISDVTNLETDLNGVDKVSLTEANENENLETGPAKINKVTDVEASENLEIASPEVLGANENLETNLDILPDITVAETKEYIETNIVETADVSLSEANENFETDPTKVHEVTDFDKSKNLDTDLAKISDRTIVETSKNENVEIGSTEILGTNKNLETNLAILSDITVAETKESLETDIVGVADVSLSEPNECLETDPAKVHEVTDFDKSENLDTDLAKISEASRVETSEIENIEIGSTEIPEVTVTEKNKNLEIDLAKIPAGRVMETSKIFANSYKIPDVKVLETSENLETEFSGISQVIVTETNGNLKTKLAEIPNTSGLKTSNILETDSNKMSEVTVVERNESLTSDSAKIAGDTETERHNESVGTDSVEASVKTVAETFESKELDSVLDEIPTVTETGRNENLEQDSTVTSDLTERETFEKESEEQDTKMEDLNPIDEEIMAAASTDQETVHTICPKEEAGENSENDNSALSRRSSFSSEISLISLPDYDTEKESIPKAAEEGTEIQEEIITNYLLDNISTNTSTDVVTEDMSNEEMTTDVALTDESEYEESTTLENTLDTSKHDPTACDLYAAEIVNDGHPENQNYIGSTQPDDVTQSSAHDEEADEVSEQEQLLATVENMLDKSKTPTAANIKSFDLSTDNGLDKHTHQLESETSIAVQQNVEENMEESTNIKESQAFEEMHSLPLGKEASDVKVSQLQTNTIEKVKTVAVNNEISVKTNDIEYSVTNVILKSGKREELNKDEEKQALENEYRESSGLEEKSANMEAEVKQESVLITPSTSVLNVGETSNKTNESGIDSEDKVPHSKTGSSLDDLEREIEEKRKLFEKPSPRRKGMIVGSTCLKKRTANSGAKTNILKKIVSDEKCNISKPSGGEKGSPLEKHHKSKTETAGNAASTSIERQKRSEGGKLLKDETESEISGSVTSNTDLTTLKTDLTTTHIIGKVDLPINKNEKNVLQKEKVVESVKKLENETDEDFQRRTETVRSARKKAVKPYESDFNFEEGESKQAQPDASTVSSASFWPSESKTKAENFDTASLYSSSSSGSSSAIGGNKEGKSRVMARCARDFGMDEAKPKFIQITPTSIVPVFPCSSPEQSTVSAMAVKIVQSIGASTQQSKPNPNILKYTMPPLNAPKMMTGKKVFDKSMFSNVLVLPSSKNQKIVKVSPNLHSNTSVKTCMLSKANIESTCKSSAQQEAIGKKVIKVSSGAASVAKGKKSIKDEKDTDKYEGKTANEEHFEPSEAILCNKTKALRALHKKDKPFKWEVGSSPPKQLRSKSKEIQIQSEGTDADKKDTKKVNDFKTVQSKKGDGANNVDNTKKVKDVKKANESRNVNTAKQLTETTRGEQSQKQKVIVKERSVESTRSLRAKKTVETGDTLKSGKGRLKKEDTSFSGTVPTKKDNKFMIVKGKSDTVSVMGGKVVTKKDHPGENKSIQEAKNTRGREKISMKEKSEEKGIRTRSRSGSKDSVRNVEERIIKKPRLDVSVKSNRQDKEAAVGIKKQNEKVESRPANTKQSESKVNVIKKANIVEGGNNSRTLRNNITEGGDDVKKNVKKNSSVYSEKVSEIAVKSAAESEGSSKVASEGITKVAQKRKSETEDDSSRIKVQKGIENFKITSEPISIEKACKLDGTSNSPESSKVTKCAHTVNIPGCIYCRESLAENDTDEQELDRPAVRQIIHRGRVFEIQRGRVTETEIQDLKTRPRTRMNEPHSVTGDDTINTRSKMGIDRRKRLRSPEPVSSRGKQKPATVGVMDINKYISQTLMEIKMQRDSNPTNRWTVKQKKKDKDAFPFSFQKKNTKP